MIERIKTTYVEDKLIALKCHCGLMETPVLANWVASKKHELKMMLAKDGPYNQYKARRAELWRAAGGPSKLAGQEEEKLRVWRNTIVQKMEDLKKEIAVGNVELRRRERIVSAITQFNFPK